MLLLISVLSITFTSCSSNDDDDAPKITSQIVGSWQTTYYTTTVGGNLTFKNDGTYYMALTTKGVTKRYNGTYEVSSGNEGVIKLYNEKGEGYDIWEFELSSDSNKLTTTPVGGSSLSWKRQ